MKKGRAGLALVSLAVLAAIGVVVLLYTVHPGQLPRSSPGRALFFKARFLREKYFPPLGDYQLDIQGNTGTPVVVGCRIDGTHSVIFHGVIPTNWTLRARRRVEISIKNVGTEMSPLRFMLSPTGKSPRGGGGGSGMGDIPPYYGVRWTESWSSSSGRGGTDGILNPTNWPETLPPSMSERQAKSIDWAAELLRSRLKYFEAQLARNPNNHQLLVAVGSYHLMLGEHGAGEEVYRRFFASDCVDPVYLNTAIWEYIEHGGTNLDRAYELAVKAQDLAEHGTANEKYQAANIADTVAWIQFKRGYYDKALNMLAPIQARMRWDGGEGAFHLAMAYYMLSEETLARTELQKALQHPALAEQAKKCLAILDLNAQSPDLKSVAMLKTRLVEIPDDPVALSRLGAMYADSPSTNTGATTDPLVLKALGMRAYQRGEYARAVDWLSQSSRNRPSDGGLYLYLGAAQLQLGHTNDSAESLRKALTLPLKAAQVEQAKELLEPDTATR